MTARKAVVRQSPNRWCRTDEAAPAVLRSNKAFAAEQVHRLSDRCAGDAVAPDELLLAGKPSPGREVAATDVHPKLVGDLLVDRPVARGIDDGGHSGHLHSSVRGLGYLESCPRRCHRLATPSPWPPPCSTTRGAFWRSGAP